MQSLSMLLEIKDLPLVLRFKDRTTISHKLKAKDSNSEPHYFQLVEVIVDDNNKPKKLKDPLTQDESYAIFNHKDLTQNTDFKTSTMMFGTFVYSICDSKQISSILINPRNETLNNIQFLAFDEVVFSPLKDSFTKHYMLTPPDQAKALLAINPSDRERIGCELVFYVITNQSVSSDSSKREEELQEKIRELAFLAPRIPIKKGSGSFLVVIVNLENKMEESAFIRSYNTYGSYSDVIFVTSDLEIKSGDFETIEYNGDHIDTIFTPIIEWQKNKHTNSHLNY